MKLASTRLVSLRILDALVGSAEIVSQLLKDTGQGAIHDSVTKHLCDLDELLVLFLTLSLFVRAEVGLHDFHLQSLPKDLRLLSTF